MLFRLKNLALSAGIMLLFAAAAAAQTTQVEGVLKGADGQPVVGASVIFERTDIKGHYVVKTDKKGHYGHYGLPLGTYNIIIQIDGKDVDRLNGVRTHLGDPMVQNFDMKQSQEESKKISEAVVSGTLTKEQERSLSAEQKAAIEKSAKEREAVLSKNKALNDAFNAGKTALDAKNYDDAIANLTKASELDSTQAVIFSQLAVAYEGSAQSKPAEAGPIREKEFAAWKKAIELKPAEAAYYNNYALALGRSKNIPDAQTNIEMAAQLDAPNAGKYYYNLGALLMNSGQGDMACGIFKKAIDTDPNYADAQYQYGVCLVGKAQTDKDGKVIPPPGTIEALQKYLELKPDGSNAEAAKGMLQMMAGSVDTKYVNPNAPKKKK